MRIMRTCRELGIATVAIFSDADRSSAHVRMADEAFSVGGAKSSESYLSIAKVLDAARKSGADAIHPGYGFLSESAAFAEACEASGMIFIGPGAEAIRAMGDKTRARALMERRGIPVAPGAGAALSDADEARRIADLIGYPVLVKAAAGGGGKGMRKVDRPEEVAQALALAQSEALSAFADERVFLEKYIERPRHIEIQILADAYGAMVHLFERECSIQRRHQKVVEEAPSSILTARQRARMGEAALGAARACGYVNAGTVEFLLDSEGKFYFMEMNTRLQVEHPVTEWVTGLDIVAEQISIAGGAPLSMRQEDLSLHGHAIECRIYAEDPSSGFLPDPGLLLRHTPPSGFGVRVDAGFEDGGEVPIFYDPMISKVSTWGRNRAEALRRMARALKEYDIAGVQTTLPFCLRVMQSEAFRKGELSTQFVGDHMELTSQEAPDLELARAAAVAAVLHDFDRPTASRLAQAERSSWRLRKEY